jgi:hypothetical protein
MDSLTDCIDILGRVSTESKEKKKVLVIKKELTVRLV